MNPAPSASAAPYPSLSQAPPQPQPQTRITFAADSLQRSILYQGDRAPLQGCPASNQFPSLRASQGPLGQHQGRSSCLPPLLLGRTATQIMHFSRPLLLGQTPTQMLHSSLPLLLGQTPTQILHSSPLLLGRAALQLLLCRRLTGRACRQRRVMAKQQRMLRGQCAAAAAPDHVGRWIHAWHAVLPLSRRLMVDPVVAADS